MVRLWGGSFVTLFAGLMVVCRRLVCWLSCWMVGLLIGLLVDLLGGSFISLFAAWFVLMDLFCLTF